MNAAEWKERKTANRHNRSARVSWIGQILGNRPLTENGLASITEWATEIVDLDYADEQLDMLDKDKMNRQGERDGND